MSTFQSRRKFIFSSSILLGAGMIGNPLNGFASNHFQNGKIGIIGLDTSHSVAFTKALNGTSAQGFKIVAAYPNGSADIESSVKRIPGYTEEVKKYGVEIVGSIAELLSKVDFVCLETNDGRPHLQQALEVFKAGKPVFIDKPVAASLTDTIAIYELAKQYKVPVFSSSSLRYMETAQQVAKGKIGKVQGADCFSPATLEATHPDLFWYGIHGVELLYTVMGIGCKQVKRTSNKDVELVVGEWTDGRVGTFRGTRTGKHEYGGTAFGETGNSILGPFQGYDNLLKHILDFFQTRIAPVSPAETIEIYTFMEAAHESKRKNGASIQLEHTFQSHFKKANQIIQSLKPTS